mmetsp:Transcript_26390/g.37734  ORF Transcript_26390/g.37734 Transcript_26390/m.37734 type:complete len:84 (+) Transcript_26390:90-341(+)
MFPSSQENIFGLLQYFSPISIFHTQNSFTSKGMVGTGMAIQIQHPHRVLKAMMSLTLLVGGYLKESLNHLTATWNNKFQRGSL